MKQTHREYFNRSTAWYPNTNGHELVSKIKSKKPAKCSVFVLFCFTAAVVVIAFIVFLWCCL